MTRAQRAEAKTLIGKMPAEEIAERIGVSVSSLKRAFRGESIWFHNGKYKNNPKLVRDVLAFYSKNGKAATKKAFPDVNVRCIVDRPLYYGVQMRPRQRRWKDQEIILAAKMAGIIDGQTQAKLFNRPGAHEGSIKSLWKKRFKIGGGNIHGMSEWMAKHLLRPGYPILKTRVWSPRKNSKGQKAPVRGIVLWVDMEPYLLNKCPTFIREGIRAMGQFQYWLFQPNHPKKEILKMLQERTT